MRKKITVLILLAVFIITAGFGCKGADQATQEAMKPITLTFWGVYDDADAFQEIITKYQTLHPYISIEYRKLRYEEYETELLNAMAEDRGPDILSLHNTWLKKYQSKLVPLPATITLPYPVVKGVIKQEVIPELRTTNTLTLKELKDNFVDVVAHDVVLDDGKIYGLPLSVDTLAMYYNRDLFNNAGISQAPAYWNKEFLQDIKKLTRQNESKAIIQAGAALGGSSNINRFSDILSVLMLQNGAVLMNDNNQVVFNVVPAAMKDSGYNPGLEALRFYTDFANPTKESYAWNATLPNSLEMFISGNLAIMFSYAYDLPTIRAQAPKLNFSVAKLPQIEGNPATNINFANYWVETVSKKSQHPNEAWDFIQFMTKAEPAKSYLEKTKKPTALRALVAAQRSDDTIGIFADQVLTAKSWYKGMNAQAAEGAIREMIEAVVNNTSDKLQSIIDTAAAKIQQTVN
jgi:multiple sugar transport system substrate-binding protein